MKKIYNSIFAIVIALNLYVALDNGAHIKVESAIIQLAGDDLIEGEY